MLLILLSALAAPPESVLIDPHQLRLVRIAGIDSALTPSGDSSPAAGQGLFLVLASEQIGLPPGSELRAAIPSGAARSVASLVASDTPITATLSRVEEPVRHTVGSFDAPRCRLARWERYSLAVVGLDAPLTGQRELPGATEVAGACSG